MEQPVSIAPPPATAKVAFQVGLIFGLSQAVIASIVLLLNTFVTDTSVGISLLLTTVSFLTGLAAYFVAGILGASKNGKLRTGVFAGMWTGGIYGIIGFVVSMILFFQVNLPKVMDSLNSSTTSSTVSPDSLKTVAMVSGVVGAVFGLLFAIGLGAGLGSLGALIGRNRSPYKQVKLVPALVPVYAPYPGQPAYPAQPYVDPNQAAYPPQPYVDPYQAAYPPQPANAEQVYIEQPAANPYDNNPPQQ